MSTGKATDPLTPRTLENARNETRVVLWALFQWIFCPFIVTVLWEHFAEILLYEYKPTYFLDLLKITVVRPFWKLFGEWSAYLSGFVELLKLDKLLDTVWKIGESIFSLLWSVKLFVDGYTSIINEYQWTTSSTIVGSIIIIALLVVIIYLFRNSIRYHWVKMMELSRWFRCKVMNIIPYYGNKKNPTAIATIG